MRAVTQSFSQGFWMRRVEVLRGVSLEVEPKTVFGFLGPNGAGKTTLIQLIAGIRKPTSGEISIGGDLAYSHAAKRRTGFLPERPYFYDFLTGEGFLSEFGKLGGLDGQSLKKRISKVLEMVDMGHAAKLELRKYSKGMLQRIGIAQALLRNPDLVVLDEPMSGLDPLGRREVRELIGRLKSEGKTVFFSSHVIPDVEAICDHVAIIQKGKIVSAGSLEELLQSKDSQVEIGFCGIDKEKVSVVAKGLTKQIEAISEGHRCVVSSRVDATELAARVGEAKGQLLWVTPLRRSLEELVVEKRK